MKYIEGDEKLFAPLPMELRREQSSSFITRTVHKTSTNMKEAQGKKKRGRHRIWLHAKKPGTLVLA